MKKIILLTALIIASAGSLQAMEISPGINTWHLRWDPNFENEFKRVFSLR